MLKKKTVSPAKSYQLFVNFNGLTFKKRTDNIEKAILDLKPEALHTEVYITVKKGQEIMERRLDLRQGRNLFINDDFRQVFLSNLIFT